MPPRSVAATAAVCLTRNACSDSPSAPSCCCLQCEQTKGNEGCTKIGVCGKTSQVAIMQDLLIYQLKVGALLSQAGTDVAGGTSVCSVV